MALDMTAGDKAKDPKKPHPWLTRIQLREKYFQDNWYKTADEALRIYEMEDKSVLGKDQTPFNILYSNTEVLLPALYSSTPVPEVVLRGDKSGGPIPEVITRMLEAVVDANTPGIETFDTAMERAVLAALVPGAGAVRIRVDPAAPIPVWFESCSHKDVIWGAAKKWNKIPWLAFVHHMSRDAVIAQFGLKGEAADKLKIPTQEELDTASTPLKDDSFCIYELWDRVGRKIIYLCEDYEGSVIEESEDLLKLAGFFPTPGLLTLVEKPCSIHPTPLYTYYRNQAEELNRVTVRLNRILAALKVRGVFNPLIGKDLAQLLTDDDTENALKPAENPMDLQSGFDKQIWLLPIERLIIVAKELYAARQQIKQVIFEITGLADIIRGSSVASETATAQNIKEKWGSVRLKRMQRLVRNYVRDLFRLTVDASAQLPVEKWQQMTRMNFLTMEEKQAKTQQIQMMSQEKGAPPPPEITKELEKPSWEELLQQLQDDVGRAYLIDVETDSTLDSSAIADREEVTEFVGALGQLAQGVGPLAQLGPSGMEVIKQILMAVTKKFRFGRELQDTLAALEIPQGPGAEDPSKKAEVDAKMKEVELSMQVAQAKHEVEMAKIEVSKMKVQLEKVKIEETMRAYQMGQMVPPQAPGQIAPTGVAPRQ